MFIGHRLCAPHEALRCLVAAVLACLPMHGAVAVERIVGRAAVIDGNTLEIAGQRIRLYGIDAPESAQICTKGNRRWLCGQQAALALDTRIAKGTVSCEPKRRDRYGALVAVCHLRGENLNAWMVDRGWALAFRPHSADYVTYERAASGDRRGLWQGNVTPAWIWRQRENRRMAPAKETRPSPPQKPGPPIRLIPANVGARRAAAR